LSIRKSPEVFSWGLGSGGWVLGIVPSPQSRVPSPDTEHLTSKPAENEFQIVDQHVGQADFVSCGSTRKTGPQKQARERFGQPLGKSLNVFRLNFIGLGISDPGLKKRAGPPHFERGENRWPAEHYGESTCWQYYLLDIYAFYCSLEIFCLGDTIA
jgi:hypothetical protein